MRQQFFVRFHQRYADHRAGMFEIIHGKDHATMMLSVRAWLDRIGLMAAAKL